MAMSADPAANLASAVAQDPRGGGPRRQDRLPARALPLALLLPDRGRCALRPGRAHPRSEHRGPGLGSPPQRGGGAGVAVRTPRARALPQHHRGDRHRRSDPGQVPQDAHPRRSRPTTRSSTSRPAISGFQVFPTAVRQPRRAGLLGSVVPRGGAPGRPARRRRHLLPDGHRLAPGREGRRRAPPSATPGGPCSAGTPSPTASTWPPSTASAWKRRPARPGLEFWGGSFLCDPQGVVLAEASAEREEILLGTRGSGAHRGGAPPVAVLARSPRRRLSRSRPRFLDEELP